MKLLYTNILPLGLEDGQSSITDYFNNAISKSDSVYIATGYASKSSLTELSELVIKNGIKKVVLTLGMYFVEGMPEGMYHTAKSINEMWMRLGIGEIRIVNNMKFHGKIYAFYKNDEPVCGIVGSNNLGSIKLDASNRRQYEVASATDCESEIVELNRLISSVSNDTCSINIADAVIPIIRERNTSIEGIEAVDELPISQVDIYKTHLTTVTFKLPIKVPAYIERHMDDNKHYTKSNLNVSYAAPRSARKARDWYETQLTVGKEDRAMEGYPEKNVPFYVITDDGYMFKAHTTSDGNKQFSAVGDELILGRWIKGRLAAAGLVTPVNNTQEDTDRTGMITKEMLAAYGCNELVLVKTNQQKEDENGNLLDVWTLSFASSTTDGE